MAILRAEGEKFFCPGWDLKAAAAGDAVDGDYGVGGFGGLQELPNLNKPVIAASERHLLRGRAGTRPLLRPDPRLGHGHLRAARNPIGHRRGCGVDQNSEAHSLSCGDGPLADRAWFDAEEALRWGLLKEITSPADLLPKAWDLARLLESGPPLVYAAIKEVVREAEALRFQDALNRVTKGRWPPSTGFTPARTSWRGRGAFAEKRDPVWKGR